MSCISGINFRYLHGSHTELPSSFQPMWWTTPFLAFFAFSKATPTQPNPTNSTVKHSWRDVPIGWVYHSTPPADDLFDLHIGLKQSQPDALIDRLLQISDPSHPSYGMHLSREQSEALVSCHPDAISETRMWLASHGIDDSRINHRKVGGDWLTLRVSIAEAERMLDTQYNVFRHEDSGETALRTLQYSLPHPLHAHIEMVAPTTYFSTVQTMRRTSFLQPNLEPVDRVGAIAGPFLSSAIPAGCSSAITPACLRALYNTTDYVPTSMSQNQLGVAGYLDEFANNADLQTFLKKYRKDAVGATFPTVQVHGGGNDQNVPGIEANLDIQYTIGMSYPTPNVYYSTGGSPPFKADSTTLTNTNEPYLDWLTYILDQPTIPQVITTSYGDSEQTVPRDYAVKVCNMFAQIGSRGTTLFFSSGDFGVGGGDCKTNDGTDKVLFQPAFPASCPWVTTVGGTTNINPEVAIKFSGGGFSRYFDQPLYQSDAVSRYLSKLGDKYSGKFNPDGRAYPDVSAQANKFQVVVRGRTISVGGTSASSPTVAGVFALLNDFRMSRGMKPLGFVNPLLYSLCKDDRSRFRGFTDIVSGSNPGCETDGFSAIRGWDPVTGLGTPSFKQLQALVLHHSE